MSRYLTGLAFLLLAPGLLRAQFRPPGGRFGHSVDLVIRVVWENDRPVQCQGCRVELQTSFGVTVGSGYTDDQGQAAFGRVAPGTYRVRVTGSEVEDAEQHFFVDPSEAFHFETVRVRAKDGAAEAGSGPTVALIDLNVPKKARKELEKGNREAGKKNWAAAAAHYRAAIQEYPSYATAYNNLGIVLFQTGDKAGSRAAFEKAVSLNDHYSEACVNLGRMLYNQGDFAAAETLMEKALRSEPRNLDALIVESSAELRQGKLALAAANALKVHDYQQPACPAPCKNPGLDRYPIAHYIAGKALEFSQKLAAARDQFQLYLAEAPDGPLAPQVRSELASLQKEGKKQGP
jgi:tetratricopeptide repeat protein